MDDNRCFRLLWRVNAVLFLVALVLAIGRFVYDGCSSWFHEPAASPSNFPTYGIDAEGKTVVTAKWLYGDPRKVPGGAGFIVPLYSTWSADEPSRRRRALRNLLFVDKALKTSRWLLPDNERDISGWELLAHEEGGKALALLFEMHEPHADAEEQGAEAHKLSLHLSRPDCTRPVRVLTGLTRCIGKELADDDHVIVFYVKDGAGHAAKIALADASVDQTTTLEPQE